MEMEYHIGYWMNIRGSGGSGRYHYCSTTIHDLLYWRDVTFVHPTLFDHKIQGLDLLHRSLALPVYLLVGAQSHDRHQVDPARSAFDRLARVQTATVSPSSR